MLNRQTRAGRMKTRTAEREFRSWVRLARWRLWRVTREVFEAELVEFQPCPDVWDARFWWPRGRLGLYRVVFAGELSACRCLALLREHFVRDVVRMMGGRVRLAKCDLRGVCWQPEGRG